MHDLLDNNEVALLLDLANLACHKGMPEEARVIVDGVLAVRPNFVPALITLAYSHLVVDDFDRALEILEPVLAAKPDDADARIVQLLTLLLAGKRSEADEAFDYIPEGCPQQQLANELRQAL